MISTIPKYRDISGLTSKTNPKTPKTPLTFRKKKAILGANRHDLAL
jgi:hypothetical protein